MGAVAVLLALLPALSGGASASAPLQADSSGDAVQSCSGVIHTNVIVDWSWWGTENGDFCLP